ncbi:transposase [Acinetobacter guillouiae]|uniref:transposase n=1 Tax=Acinetobacter guillouiae TaxID=106649 RepID=UPI001244B3A5|nr:transposase [Acinetobacter guillouiae]KAB0626483.1 hypothetical protein F7P82_12455 [Acinetobacter guillouiae]
MIVKNQTNTIGAIYQIGLFGVGLFDCKVNSDVFHFWVKEFFNLELPKQSIVVMDNVTFHKRSDTQELLEQHEHHILWLPLYSPDLNLIEMAWVKNKRKNG